jgi:cyclopropane fatty-acyl-phospholipid synthase-like methyltransferase
MALDPVHRSQLAVRRAGQLLRRGGVLRPARHRHEFLEGERLERFFATGEKQVQRLSAALETHTGASLHGRHALDFGCGLGRTTLPLAARCELVYGLDVSPLLLEKAADYADERGLANIEWMDSGRLPELTGQYDLAISFWVFQHIPSREGERIFAQILNGLRPGGLGALQFLVRTRSTLEMARRRDIGSLYMALHSYSLSRLGELLAQAGVEDWHVRWSGEPPRVNATLFFRKGDPPPPWATRERRTSQGS